jgi:predicted PurR-regulated permease PerM
MKENDTAIADERLVNNVLDIAIKLGVITLIVYLCFKIVSPFITPVIWATVIAISIYPLFKRSLAAFGGRNKLTAAVYTLLGLALLITPVVLLSGSLIDGVQTLSKALEGETLQLPPPPQKVADWPLIGNGLYDIWQLAATNITEVITRFTPQLKTIGSVLFSTALEGGLSVLQFVISIFIAGVFLASASFGKSTANAFALRLSPIHGEDFVKMASATIRSVAQGVLGIAFVQASFVGLGFWAVNVPGAGLWAFFVLILSVIQLPPLLVIAPVIAYVFSTDGSTITLVIFTLWSLLGSMLDSILKPFVMGRGVDVPMLVIMLGAIGGMIYSGILGLFTGAIILGIGYNLYLHWLTAQPANVDLNANENSQ